MLLGVIRKFFERKRTPYARKVAIELIRDGFDPRELERMKALETFTQGSYIFDVLARRRLKPSAAATAIRLASHRYRAVRPLAEKEGWPLKTRRPGRAPREQAYFMELLDEAADSLRFAR